MSDIRRESDAAESRDVEQFKNYLRDFLAGAVGPDILIDTNDARSFIWVDVEGQCFWRISVEAVDV